MTDLAKLPAQSSDRTGLGVGLMLVAWLLFSFTDLSVKWLIEAGMASMVLAFIRYAVHFLIAAMRMLVLGISIRPDPGTTGPIFLRAGLLVSATTLNFIALKYLQVTTTSAIMFSAPLIVCALSGPLLAERVGPIRWMAIALGFVGVLVVIRPFGTVFHWAMLIVLYNAFALALFSIMTRRLAGRVGAAMLQFWMGALGTLILLPFAVIWWTPPSDLWHWLVFLAVGAWAWAGHELMTRAHEVAPANLIMPYTYSFMIYLALGAWIVFGHLPDAYTVAGATIIVLSGLVIWIREVKLA